ncbi:MAG: hypothetical protein FJX80_02240 [Bacteroidetes bacterium]|nr:hypothetical protein [Bacteroidota bacterium]
MTIASLFVMSIFLFYKLYQVEDKLSKVSNEANKLSQANVELEVPFDKKIAINNEPLSVENLLNTHAVFDIDEEIKLNNFVVIDEILRVPINIEIDTFIQLTKHDIFLEDNTVIKVINDTIPVNERIQINRFGLRKLNLPISTKIPINQTLKIKLEDTLSMDSKIPVKLTVRDTILYKLNLTVPIKFSVPVKLPINQGVDIEIKNPISVTGKFPINERVNVKFNVSSTELAEPLKEISDILRSLGSLLVPF